MTFDFPKPGKAYKQVKATTEYLADERGEPAKHRVPVYLATSGDVSFAIGLPDEYLNAWMHHRDKQSVDHRNHLVVKDRAVHGCSFNEVHSNLKAISENFARHVKSIRMQKVIQIKFTAKTSDGKQHEAPSFDTSQVLVGLTCDVRWAVNGRMYEDCTEVNRNWPFGQDNSQEPLVEGTQPDFKNLRATGDNEGTIIPYTDETWASIQAVRDSIDKAAHMLMALTKAETAAALLSGGANALLTMSPKNGDAS